MQNMLVLKSLKDEGVDIIKDARFAPATDIVLGALAAFAPALQLLSFVAAGSLCLRGLLQLFVSKTEAYTNNLNDEILDNMEGLLNDDSFVEKLRMSYNAAVNSHSDEKAALFANLLNGASDKNISTDLFFELNQLLSSLSVRQMELLADLKKRPTGKNE